MALLLNIKHFKGTKWNINSFTASDLAHGNGCLTHWPRGNVTIIFETPSPNTCYLLSS